MSGLGQYCPGMFFFFINEINMSQFSYVTMGFICCNESSGVTEKIKNKKGGGRRGIKFWYFYLYIILFINLF